MWTVIILAFPYRRRLESWYIIDMGIKGCDEHAKRDCNIKIDCNIEMYISKDKMGLKECDEHVKHDCSSRSSRPHMCCIPAWASPMCSPNFQNVIVEFGGPPTSMWLWWPTFQQCEGPFQPPTGPSYVVANLPKSVANHTTHLTQATM